ncbi:hypothetical protein WE666_005152, partial [Escherichia coli O117:H42]
ASALDVTEEVINSILQTMQGRVLDGDLITGWEKRQVLKEDNGNISQTAKSPAERKRAQRERERKREQNGDCHGASRNVTHMSRRVTTDKDTDQEDQNTMVHGVKNATNQAGDVQTVKTGTEFVQRATTFFGPDRNFENPWLLPVSGTNNQRCVNHISEPDNEIPPGFRG